jgi:hypothetical protein
MKILAVDLSNVFWSIALGVQLNDERTAVSLALDEIARVASGVARADRVVVACDGPQSWRRSIWPKYKADRPERAEHLWRLLAETMRHCKASGWHLLIAPETPDGCAEADDVIGSVVTWARKRGHSVDILSGDSDLAQLVGESATMSVRLLRRYKGVTPLDSAGVFEWLGVAPSGVVDVKALAGDAGDGYGDIFPGFGEVSAIKALMLDERGAPKHDAAHVVATACRIAEEWVAAGRPEGKAKPKANVLRLWLEGAGPERVKIGLRLAMLDLDLPLDFEIIEKPHEPKPLPEFGAAMLPSEPRAEVSDPDDESTWCSLSDTCGLRDGHPGPCAISTEEQAAKKTLAEPVTDAGKGQTARAADGSAARAPQATNGDAKSPAVASPEAGPSLPSAHGSAEGSAADGFEPVELSDALATVDTTARMLIPANEAFARLVEFRALIRRVLTPSVDFGTIAGCGPRPVLFLSGAQKLAEVYGFTPSYKFLSEVENFDAGPPFFYFKVRCRLRRKSDRMIVAECVASCNSRETKYGGRWVYERQVPEHLDKSRLKTRTFRDKKTGETITQWRVPNEDICDQINTIQKMAQKRALVGAVIFATRSGGVFDHDIEDIPQSAFGEQFAAPQWEKA